MKVIWTQFHNESYLNTISKWKSLEHNFTMKILNTISKWKLLEHNFKMKVIWTQFHNESYLMLRHFFKFYHKGNKKENNFYKRQRITEQKE